MSNQQIASPSSEPASASSDLRWASATELAAAYRSGEVSPVEATAAVLSAIDQHNDALGAYCQLDHEAALTAARAAEQRIREGNPRGPLDGVPTSIKDIFLTRGRPTLRGSRLLADKPGARDASSWNEDAPVSAAVEEAGCVVVGKTTTPEFAWKGVTDSPLTGTCRNPHDLGRTAGGSSGGAAAAVAAGMGPLAVGTDGGGSVRIPAAFCGAVALKPTYGLIPLYPSSPFGTLAHAGPITRTVADVALLMDALVRPDARDWSAVPTTGGFATAVAAASGGQAAFTNVEGAVGGHVGSHEAPLAGLRIAYSPTLGFGRNDPEVQAHADAAAQALVELGAQVEQVDPPIEDPVEAFHVLWFAGVAAVLEPYGADALERIDPSLRAALGRHSGTDQQGFSAQNYLDAVAVRMDLGHQMGAFHEEYDLLLSPTVPIPAFDVGADTPPGWHSPDWTSWTPYTYPFNMTQQPALSLPSGMTAQGLPVSVQLVGARFADHTVLRVGAALENALGNAPRPSLVVTGQGQ